MTVLAFRRGPDWWYLYAVIALVLVFAMLQSGCAGVSVRSTPSAATQEVSRGGNNYGRCPYGLDTDEAVRELLRGAELEHGECAQMRALAEAGQRNAVRDRDYWRSVAEAQAAASTWEKIGWGSAGVVLGALAATLLVIYAGDRR